MMDLAESLSHLNAALSARRRSMAAEFLDTTAGRMHPAAALITAEGCAHLAAAGVLARNNGFRLARSCLQLAICAGRAGPANAVAHAEAGFGDDADATLLPGLILRVPETVACSTVFIGRQPPPGVSEAAYLAMLCSTAVGQPAALEWLATVAKALLHKYSLHGVSVARLGVAASASVGVRGNCWCTAQLPGRCRDRAEHHRWALQGTQVPSNAASLPLLPPLAPACRGGSVPRPKRQFRLPHQRFLGALAARRF